MKTPGNENPQQTAKALTLHTPVLPRLPANIHHLVVAAYASRGGMEHMTLQDWRDAEQQLISRFQNENHGHQR